MRQVNLLAVPNQALSVSIDGVLWNLRVVQARNCMAVDVSRNGEMLILGQRIIPNSPILPYRYLSTYGNFAILTLRDEFPNWKRFGIDQSMIYVSASELGIND